MNPSTRAQQSPGEDRPRSSRWMGASRALWYATRARNASRRRWRITVVGGLAVVATLLVLVLVPREVDRAYREQLDQLPQSQDTLALARQIIAMTSQETARVAALRRAELLQITEPTGVPTASLPVVPDAIDVDLDKRMARAREIPLAENFLALAEAGGLEDDARVHAIADSIGQVDRERDAYAALGGADARYATLTARLATLGQRLMVIAESRRAVGRQSGVVDSSASLSPIAASTIDSMVVDGMRQNGRDPVPVAVAVDSAPTRRAAAADSIERVRQQLAAVRLSNAALEQRRENVRTRLNVSVPPFAMLLSALIVGLSVGYGVAVVRELRRPTVGDEAEVERMTIARVIVQRVVSNSRQPQTARRRTGDALPSIIAIDESSYPLLHLALTGTGDVAHDVEIIAEHARFATVVAINVATVAARESRTTLVVEDATSPHLVDEMLRQCQASHVASASASSTTSVTSIMLARDLTVDVLRAKPPAIVRAREADRYDLTLRPAGGDVPANADEACGDDVIICVRLAATPLAWLTAVTERVHARRQRIRAVLLWVTDLPTG